MAAPIGNKNAAKAKVWEQALRRSLARSSGDSVDAGLDRLADQVVSAASTGEKWAIEEIANRLDGKAAQSMTVSGNEDAPLVVNSLIRLVRPD